MKIFTSTESAHVREVVTSSQEGGASLNVLSGLVAGNFSGYWMGVVIVVLTGIIGRFIYGLVPSYGGKEMELSDLLGRCTTAVCQRRGPREYE